MDNYVVYNMIVKRHILTKRELLLLVDELRIRIKSISDQLETANDIIKEQYRNKYAIDVTDYLKKYRLLPEVKNGGK